MAKEAKGQTPKQKAQQQPTIAPGLEDDELHRDATPEEIERGDYTMVTRLAWDENENGSDNDNS